MILPHHEMVNGCDVAVEKTDRRLDPYMGWVICNDVIVHSGLHATAEKALSWVRKKAKETL